MDRADWEFSVGLRPQPAVRAAIDTVDENAWMTLDDGPADVDRAIAETTLNGRRLVVGGLRSLDCRGVLPPS